MGNRYIPSERIDTPKRKGDWDERQWRRFRQMVADGASIKEIAESLGTNLSMVSERKAALRAEQEKAA